MAETRTTGFGEWDKEDLMGGMVYKRSVVETGTLTIDVPYQIVHHGELNKADHLRIKELVQELSGLLRYVVTYNEIEYGYEGEPVLPNSHELTIALGTSSKQDKTRWQRLLSGFCAGPPKKLVQIMSVGLAKVLAQEKQDAYEAGEVIEQARRFEGPIWNTLVNSNGEGYTEIEDEDEDEDID